MKKVMSEISSISHRAIRVSPPGMLFPSVFFTLDFAELNDGSWKILEAGDGSVSGPSEGQNLEAFYRAIYQCLN